MEEKLKSIMADIFVCKIEDITQDTKKADLKNWDSLQHLIFSSRLEETFNVKFTPEEINFMTDFAKIVTILKQKQ